MKRVLVVGAGCTGSCVAVQLRKALGKKASIDVWEKARGAGGRMTTTRQEISEETVRADVGAQYLSVDMSDIVSKELVDVLLKDGIVREVDPKLLSATPERPVGGAWAHFAGTDGGVNSALKCLLDEAGATPHYERRVASIDAQGSQWRVRPFDGPTENFDAVVIAVPGCGWGNDNLNKIHGGWEGLIGAECNRRLKTPEHDHRFAVVLFLSAEYVELCDKFFGPSAIEKQIDDDMVHLLAYQSRKTAVASGTKNASAVIVAHTTHKYSSENRNAGGKDRWFLDAVAERVLYGHLGLARNLRINRVVQGSKVITWKQCQVTKAIEGSGEFPRCQPLSDSPALVLAGDYFTQSNFSGCAASAADAAKAVAAMIEGKSVTPADKGKGTRSTGKGKGGYTEADSKGESQGKSKGKGKDGKDGKGKGKRSDGKGKEGAWKTSPGEAYWSKSYVAA
mmetsp:Transcript_76506/g.164083  ORF Transcript_76506/g.164083 Transcript_76506/m.164083 type:complete len:451 (+) Transcript_76506:46-1398(+)